MKKSSARPATALSVLCALLLLCCTATMSYSSIFSYEHKTEDNQVATAENTVTNSQDSTKKITPSSNTENAVSDGQMNFSTEIPGVGVFLNNVLDSLIRLTSDSENRFKALSSHLPLVFPDLYKVFITL